MNDIYLFLILRNSLLPFKILFNYMLKQIFLPFDMNFLCPQNSTCFIVLETFTFYLLFLR